MSFGSVQNFRIVGRRMSVIVHCDHIKIDSTINYGRLMPFDVGHIGAAKSQIDDARLVRCYQYRKRREDNNNVDIAYPIYTLGRCNTNRLLQE